MSTTKTPRLDDVRQLHDALVAAHYTVDDVTTLIGAAGQAGLLRNQATPARRALKAVDSPLATLVRLFILQQSQPRAAVEQALGDLDRFGWLLAAEDDTVRALIDVRPYASPDDGADGWLVSDLTPNLDGMMRPVRPDYVLGASPASTSLAQLVDRSGVRSALDLGCGCGIQSLHLARHADRVVATDLNPRACDLTRWTFALCGVDADVREGSLYEPVAGERFDLIVSNPPYVMAPPAKDGEKLTYREGDMRSDDLVRSVVEGALDHLTPGGLLQVLGSWRTGADEDGLPRHLVQKAIDAGCDVRVTERERLGAQEYIELWLADAGLVGTPEYQQRYEEWLAYFEQLGIDEVGMGWIWLRTPDPSTREHHAPAVLLESRPDPVAQPVGWAYRAWIDAVDLLQPSPQEDPDTVLPRHVRNLHLTVSPHVDEERYHVPGEEEPHHIVLRLRSGFGGTTVASTALAAVVASCDGDLPVGVIIDAVAQILELSPPEIDTLELAVRSAVLEGVLLPRS